MTDERNDVMDLLMIFPRKMNVLNRAIMSRYMRDTRLKPSHLMMIKTIGVSEGTSQKGLCEALPFDKSYVSTEVRELIEMGLVHNDSEGKIHSLRLTEAGRSVMAMGDMMLDMISMSLMDTMTQEEREVMRGVLRKIDERMDEMVEGFSTKDDS